jgi:hypothetical protein
MKNLKNYGDFLKENRNYDSVVAANVKKHLDMHDTYVSNMKAYGTVDVRKPYASPQKCVMASCEKTGKNKYAVWFVTSDQVKDKSYSGSSGVGVEVTVDEDFNVVKTDIQIKDEDKDKLSKFIKDKK